MSRISNYLKDTQAELKHVKWPTQKQSIVFTLLVIGLSLFVSLYLGLFDYGFTRLLNLLINR